MPVRIFEMEHRNIPQPHGMLMISLPFNVVQPALTALGDGTARSLPFAGTTRVIVVQSDEKIAVRTGASADSPVAAVNDYQIEAGGERTFLVSGGHVLAARLL